MKRTLSINDLIDNKHQFNTMHGGRQLGKDNLQTGFYQRTLSEKEIQDVFNSFNADKYIGNASATTGASSDDISADAVAAVFDMLKAK